MAINWGAVRILDDMKLLWRGRRVLDIGCSNLYSATADDLHRFIVEKNPRNDGGETARLAKRLAEGSTHIPGKGCTNESFVGELFEAAGMEYLSFDIFHGYKTEIMDFNRQSLPEHHKGGWDIILNCGTTEHVFNQFNIFKIIHEATKVGGHMFHSVPVAGFCDHGYFHYNGRFFFDLAGYNGYRIEDLFFHGSISECSKLYESVLAYAPIFPALGEYLQNQQTAGSRAALNGLPRRHALGNLLDRWMRKAPREVEGIELPNVCLSVLYQKIKDGPFLGAIEPSTTAGAVPDEVMKQYNHTGY